MDWLTLHITTGAAVASERLGKGHILLDDEGTLLVNFEESGEMEWSPQELQDALNGQIMNDEPVTVWFQPQTENSVTFDVPITDWGNRFSLEMARPTMLAHLRKKVSSNVSIRS